MELTEKGEKILSEGLKSLSELEEARIKLRSYSKLPLSALRKKKKEIEAQIREVDKKMAEVKRKKTELIQEGVNNLIPSADDKAVRMICGEKDEPKKTVR